MELIVINYLAVLVSAVLGMALGAFWYSPAGFGKKWVAMMGWNEAKVAEMKNQGKQSYVIAFISSLLMAYVLAHFVVIGGALTAAGGMQVAFWAWLGFIATTSLGGVLWEGKSRSLWALNAGYYLVSLLIMGAVLAVWQ